MDARETEVFSVKLRNSLLLLLTAVIWGCAFVAQSVGMDYVGPFTFLCSRSVIGAVVLLPVIAGLEKRKPAEAPADPETRATARKTLVAASVCCGGVMFAASMAQQVGLLYTTVGKVGFLTACYILFVPIMGIFLGRRCGVLVWCGVGLAALGMYFLCIQKGVGFGRGDLIALLSAVLFAGHILVIDHFSPKTDSIKLACGQFVTCALFSAVGMLLVESPTLAALKAAWLPIAYAGALSSGVGFTLQVVGQKGMNPTVASLIMSLESVVSVLAGWVLLGQAMNGREIFGCVLMFAAIVLAQMPKRSGGTSL